MLGKWKLNRCAAVIVLLLLVLQSLLTILFMYITGAYEKLAAADSGSVLSKMESRSDILQLLFEKDIAQLNAESTEIEQIFTQTLSEADSSDINNPATQNELLTSVLPILKKILKGNAADNVMFIINSEPVVVSENRLFPAISLRNDASERNGIEIVYVTGPDFIAESAGITIDKNHQSMMAVPSQSRFYDKIIGAAEASEQENKEWLGYWAEPFYDEKIGEYKMTYSIPLIVDGRCAAIIAIDYLTRDLRDYLPSSELSEKSGCTYFLGLDDVRSSSDFIVNGYGFVSTVETSSSAIETEEQLNSKQTLVSFGESMYMLYKEPVNVYPLNSYYSEEWYLFAAVPYTAADNLVIQFLLLQVLCLILTAPIIVFLYLFFSRYFAANLQKISEITAKAGPMVKPEFPPYMLKELDDISSAITGMTRKYEAGDLKMTRIVDNLNIPVATFEIPNNGSEVLVTASIGSFIEIGTAELVNGRVERNEWDSVYGSFLRKIKKVDENRYHMTMGGAAERWITLKTFTSDSSTVGVIIDITREVQEQHQREYEQDFDCISGMMNRRYFISTAETVLAEEYISTAFLSLYKLTELRQVNSEYGYSIGDRCIKLASQAIIESINPVSCSVSRFAGDTFALFQFGVENISEYEKNAEEIKRKISKCFVELKNGSKVHLAVKLVSVAYPRESSSVSELVRAASEALTENI